MIGCHQISQLSRGHHNAYQQASPTAGWTPSPVSCSSLAQAHEQARGVSRCFKVYAESIEDVSAQETGEPDLADLVDLGVFGPPHGTGGEIRLQAITDSLEERLAQPGAMWARQRAGRGHKPLLPLEIESVRDTVTKGRATWLLKIEGIDSMEEAETLRGHTLHMLAEDRPDLEDDDEFYVQELVGMQVVMEGSREFVGTVTEVFDGTGAHDLLRVEMGTKAESSASTQPVALIPFVKDIVPVVDREAGFLGITPPEGLLDIKAMLKNNSTTKKNKTRRWRPSSKPPAPV